MQVLIRKFKALQDVTVEVPAIIEGGNALGKTTILEAIAFVLTGKDLTGSTFEEVYDFRADLHDAIADVEYTDKYGNKYRRVVRPQFQTNRQGEEKIKVLRNTQCYYNDIECNDYAEEFKDFLTLGTSWLFVQKQDTQRKVFIDLLKRELPTFDLSQNQALLKQLQKQSNAARNELEVLNAAKIIDVEVPEITIDDSEYQSAIAAMKDATEQAQAVKAANQAAIDQHNKAYSNTVELLESRKQKVASIKRHQEELNAQLTEWENKGVMLGGVFDLTDIKEKIELYKGRLETLVAFDSLEDAYQANLTHPVIQENIAKIAEINKRTFVFDDKTQGSNCPFNNQYCEIANTYAEKAARKQFELQNEEEKEALKIQNRNILTRILNDNNAAFNSVRSEVEELEKTLAQYTARNAETEKRNKQLLAELKAQKEAEIEKIKIGLQLSKNTLIDAEEKVAVQEQVLAGIQGREVELQQVAEATISDELAERHRLYTEQYEAKLSAEAVNKHNEKLRAENETEREKKRAAIMELTERITALKQAISDYFANLANVITEKFAGQYKIELKLQEYVITNDDYKDCFRVIANGKEYPHGCNGAMQKNVECQLLNGLQKLAGYNGLTVIDNAEANTTIPLDTLELNAVVAKATENKELTLK